MIVIRLLAAAGLAATALVSAQTASASPDDAFIDAIETRGITFPSQEYAVGTARQVCDLIDDGRSPTSVASEISDNSGLEVEDTGFFVGAAIGVYCPWNKDEI